MLKWYEENGKLLGFDDDTLMYIVDYDAEEGWRWLDVFEGWGVCEYDNAEDAKAGAESDYALHPDKLDLNDEPFYTPEEIEEILGDMLYEERKDAQAFK